MLLADSLKHSIHMIDAYLMNRTLGTLIVDDGQAYLELEVGELLTLNDSFEIEVITDSGYYPITYHEAVNTMSTDGWSLYGGFKARVRKEEK
ncbi:hypothetical protein [Robertmurraya sp. Marseille-Q9965]